MAIPKRKTIPIDELRALLRLEFVNGVPRLYWRARPITSFATPNAGRTWNTKYADQRTGITREPDGYLSVRIHGKKYQAHRVIWALYYGEWPEGDIDHRNRRKYDNRIRNMRIASTIENGQNRSVGSNNKSGHVGVSWCKRQRQWMASIKADGKRKFLGYFDDVEMAAGVRRAAERANGFIE